MAKFRYVLLPLLLVGASTAFACSNHQSSDSADSDRIMVNASQETRSQIGVATWGFDIHENVGEPTTMVVHGYDDGHARILEYKQSSPGTGMLSATLDANGTKTELALKKSDETTSEVVANSFRDNDKALRILGRLAADLHGQSSPSGGLSSTSAYQYGSGLHITDNNPTVQGDGGLVNSGTTCLVLLPESSNWPTECALRPLGSKCQTPPQTDSSARCDRVGDPVCPDTFVMAKDEYDSKLCSRVDRIHPERGDLLKDLCHNNCSSKDDIIKEDTTTKGTVEKKISVETTKSHTVTFGTQAEATIGEQWTGEANFELAKVSTSLSAQLKIGVNYQNVDAKTDVDATSQGETWEHTFHEEYGSPTPPHTRLIRYMVNDVIDYTLITYTRTNNYWVKSEGTGQAKVPTEEGRDDLPATACSNPNN